MDLGVVAHLASLRSSVPFVHFFDGTSLWVVIFFPTHWVEGEVGGFSLTVQVGWLNDFFLVRGSC